LPTVANALRHYVSPERGYEIIRQLAISRGRDERNAHQEARELLKKWDASYTPSQATYAAASANTGPNIDRIRSIVSQSAVSVLDLFESSS
jgi:hypothetical protein